MKVQDISQITFQGATGRDEFQRERIAEKVIRLLTSSVEISPMLIDGDWGTGKTEFCHKLMNKLKAEHQDLRVLYIDAFRADHADNPLLTVLSAVLSLLPEDSLKSSLRTKAIPILRFAAVTVGKAVAAHVLQQNTEALADGIEESLQDATDYAIDATVKALLKDHEEAEKNLIALQASLAQIAKEQKIIIFIDELDRCRPDFSVQMLETVKHTLNVEGVQFIFVTNTRQLNAAINHRYGHQVDAQRYLDKFLKFRFRLPDFIPAQHGSARELNLAATHHFSLLARASLPLKDTVLKPNTHWPYDFTLELINKNSLSLREVETFVRHLEIYQELCGGLTTRTYANSYQGLRIFGVFLFCFHPDTADSVIKNRANADTLASLLGASQAINTSTRNFCTDLGFLIAQDSSFNQSKYAPSDAEPDSKKQWAEIRKMYLSDEWGRAEDSHSHIKHAIHQLQLSGT